jgi:sterol desaturase/sphingolipid hydroxylase (fatty acid hydroxylase superfamily)
MFSGAVGESIKEQRRCDMTTISEEPARVASDKRKWTQFLVAEMWTSLAISVIWLTVLLAALFGPDIVTTSAGGDSSVVPSAVVVAIFAFLATWVVAKHGFRHDRMNSGTREPDVKGTTKEA